MHWQFWGGASWPLLRERFVVDDAWLVRCSILSALAEDPSIDPAWLLDLAQLAINDGDGTVRVGGTEILGRLVHDSALQAAEARALLQELQRDGDHRVVAAALNGLQTSTDGALSFAYHWGASVVASTIWLRSHPPHLTRVMPAQK